MAKELVHEINGIRYFSTDGGKSWGEMPVSTFEHEVDGKIYVSKDGKNWERKLSGTEKIVKKSFEKAFDWLLHGSDKGNGYRKFKQKRKGYQKRDMRSFEDNKRMYDDPFSGSDKWNSTPFDRR